MMDVISARYSAIKLFPNIYVKPNAMRFSVFAKNASKPVSFSVLIKPFPIVFNVSDNSCFFFNFHNTTPFIHIIAVTDCIVNAVRYMRIKKITFAGIEPVYNMTVDVFHNYIIDGNVVLKNCDAARYFCITRTLGAERFIEQEDELLAERGTDYDEEMTGGDMDASYLTYGGE